MEMIAIAGAERAVGKQTQDAINGGMNGQQPRVSRVSACERQRFPLCRYRRSAALIMAESSIENALATSASVRSVGLLRSAFQLAYISFGIPEGIRQFQLTPASVDTQLGELRTHGVT